MAASDREWQVTRTDGTVVVDVSGVGQLSEADTEAIITATEDLLDDDVGFLEVHGPRFNRPFSGLARTMKAMYRLADRHGTPILVRPI